MGRKKLIVCNLTFDDNETIEEKILKMFSPENLINCFSETNYESYKRVIDHANIQMILNDEELMSTIFAFFENSLNTSITSSKTFMHRNTLIYRLDKIQKLIGLDIREFNDAVVFENLLIFYEMIKESEKN